jgi:hypothetical protein
MTASIAYHRLRYLSSLAGKRSKIGWKLMTAVVCIFVAFVTLTGKSNNHKSAANIVSTLATTSGSPAK